MIFSPITKLSTKAEKTFCFELIDVYCRHVEVYCQVNKIKIPSVSLSNEIVSELRLLGIVEQDSDVVDLQKELKGGFSRLINAINIVLAYPTLRTNELKKLYNSERKKLQANWQEKPLRIVDFFCGAGGLSLGFIQEGFTVALANDIEDVCRYFTDEQLRDSVLTMNFYEEEYSRTEEYAMLFAFLLMSDDESARREVACGIHDVFARYPGKFDELHMHLRQLSDEMRHDVEKELTGHGLVPIF